MRGEQGGDGAGRAGRGRRGGMWDMGCRRKARARPGGNDGTLPRLPGTPPSGHYAAAASIPRGVPVPSPRELLRIQVCFRWSVPSLTLLPYFFPPPVYFSGKPKIHKSVDVTLALRRIDEYESLK